MKKILVWSDLHAHAWQAADHPDRWKDCIDVIRHVGVLANAHKVDLVVFCGDLFENKRTLQSHVAAATYTALQSMHAELRCPSVYLAGNHDVYSGQCTLDPLVREQPKVFIVCHQCSYWEFLKGIHLAFIPSGHTKALPADARYNIAFTHHEISGAKHYASLESAVTTLPVRTLDKAEGRWLIVNGHYHNPQLIKRRDCVPVLCCGAPLEHSWRDLDSDRERGAVLLEVGGRDEPFKWTHIRFEFPRFLSKSRGKEGDFIYKEPKSASAVPARTHREAEHLGGAAKLEDMLEEYVDAIGAPNAERRSALVQMGKEFVRGEVAV